MKTLAPNSSAYSDMSKTTHGERLIALETRTEGHGREIGQVRDGMLENGRKIDSVRKDVLAELKANHREIIEALKEDRGHMLGLMNGQDQSIDELDTRMTASENQKKGAMAILSTLYALLGGALVWLADKFSF